MTESYDLAVIGAGPGGYVAAIRAAQLGLRIICIDKRKAPGGTCLNVGCIPSKALLQSTLHYATLIDSAREEGIVYESLRVDFGNLMSHKQRVVKSLVDGVAGLLKKNGITWARGEAQLASDHRIEINAEGKKETVEAKNILLATGSEATPLPFLPFDEERIVSSTGALSLKAIPNKLLVVGAGVIGVELASVYRRLGSKVTIVEMLEQICPAMDLDVSKALLQILRKQGMDIHLGMRLNDAGIGPDSVVVSAQDKTGDKTFTTDVVLVAIGRRPYTEGLNLSQVGVKTTQKGFVEVDDRFRTSVPHIYAIGDMIEGVMLAHRASEEGVAVVELLAGLHPRLNYMAIPNVIYTHPEVASVGLTEQEAKDAGLQVLIGKFFMRANPRARCSGETEGFVKVVGDRATGRLVGMHIIAANASEMIGEGVLAIEQQVTLEGIARASHAHPTLSEAIKEACLHALGRVIHA